MANKDLQGKLVVITGGARGIGRATAVEFLQAGARVRIADLDLEVAQTTAQSLASIGPITASRLDVRVQSQFDNLVAEIERDNDSIDILVNNAGIMSLGGFLDHDEGHDRQQIDINLFGVIHGMRAVLPHMKARSKGHIVNLASLAGRVGVPHAASYSASKFAVIGVTEAVRQEYRGLGIDFTVVMPYLVNTELASGTRGLPWPPIVEPKEVAEAIIRGIQRRSVEVYVPKIGRLTTVLPVVLPRKWVDWISDKLGLLELFQTFDASSRAAYIERTTKSSDSAAAGDKAEGTPTSTPTNGDDAKTNSKTGRSAKSSTRKRRV